MASSDTRFFRYPQETRASPSSNSSTSRLLSWRQESVGSIPIGAQHSHVRRSSSFTRNSDQQTTRVFIRKMPSPAIGYPRTSPLPPGYQKISCSSDSDFHYHSTHRNSDVFLPSDVTVKETSHSAFYTREAIVSSSVPLRPQHRRSSSLGAMPYSSRTSSYSDVATPLSLQQSTLAEEAIRAPRISRTSSRRSNGAEWTEHHWHKIKDLEQESERARRCSKLSSGFAPLMVFGGLVFICIGISASTNTGKDKDRLKDLSAAPIAMGVFMILLGVGLILTWFACRSRAQQLDNKLLHGSRRNSAESQDNVMQTMLTKLYTQIERTGLSRSGRPASNDGPNLNGVVVDKPASLPTAVAEERQYCHRCPSSVVSRETSV